MRFGFAATFAALAIVLAGCSRSASPAVPPDPGVGSYPMQAVLGASGGTTKLYASDGDAGFVYVFDAFAKDRKPLRRFGPFNAPTSLATDAEGNVYVPDNGTGAYDGRVYVVRPGESKPFRTLNDHGALPSDLTVDASGTVYVANGYDTHGCGGGDVRVFPKGATQAAYTVCDTALGQPYSQVNGIAIDTDGNIFVSWESGTNTYGLVREFTAGPHFTGHFLRPTFKDPYAVAIDARRNLVVADVRAPAVEVFTIGAKRPKFVLAKTGDPLHVAFTSSGNQVFVADALANEIDEYEYPGGKLIGQIAFPGRQLDGIALGR